jgi:hypothetical protein
MKSRPVSVAAVLLVAFAVSASIAFAGTSSGPASQLMFEGNGSGTFNSQSMQFGFSVRCYGANCVGALVLGSQNAAYYVTGTVSQVQQETYMISLSSPQITTNTPRVSCSLVNSPPMTPGETNTVTMTCSSPAGTGVSHQALVEVMSLGSN